jgi:DNA-binding response OmpR family regulator
MPLQGNTILVVDDDGLVRHSVRLLLEQQGYRVLVAEDGNAALRAIDEHGVDLVLLDVIMPEKEGIETLREIKRLHPHVRVVVMSGGGRRVHLDLLTIASKLGADGTFRKPDGFAEIVSLVDGQFSATA